MGRLRVFGVTACLTSLAGAGVLHGCAQAQGDGITLDASADGRPPATRLDGGADVTLTRHADAGKPDAGVDSTFGFDAYVPPNKDAAEDARRDAPVDTGPGDAARDTGFDAGIDSGHDAGFLVFFGPPGSPCSNEGTFQSQTCGICGTQKSECIVRPDGGVRVDGAVVDSGSHHHHDEDASGDAGPDLVWGDFGDCSRQIDGGCVPGSTMHVACGICGTQKLLCEPDCEFAATNCTGQVDGGCVPGSSAFDIVASCEADGGLPHDSGHSHHHPGPPSHDSGVSDTGASDTGATDTGAHDTGVSDTGVNDTGAHDTGSSDAHDAAVVDSGRDAAHDAGQDAGPVASPIVAGNAQTCSNSCEWKTDMTCELPPSTLTIASQPTGKVTTIVNFSATQETGRLGLTEFTGGCPTSVQALQVPYGFVTIKNSSMTQMATVSAWTWQVGAVAVTTYITAYATTPVTPANFEHCMGQVSDSCFDMTDPTSCLGNYGGLMLADSDPVMIPAGGSVVLFVQDQKNFADDIAPVEVTVRTESFQ